MLFGVGAVCARGAAQAGWVGSGVYNCVPVLNLECARCLLFCRLCGTPSCRQLASGRPQAPAHEFRYTTAATSARRNTWAQPGRRPFSTPWRLWLAGASALDCRVFICLKAWEMRSERFLWRFCIDCRAGNADFPGLGPALRPWRLPADRPRNTRYTRLKELDSWRTDRTTAKAAADKPTDT